MDSRSYLLDTSSINRAVDARADASVFAGKRVCVTHVLRNELDKTPGADRRRDLILMLDAIGLEQIPTESMALDVSEWDQAKWATDDLAEKLYQRVTELDRKDPKGLRILNRWRDALTADTAIKNRMILVCEDKNLCTAATEHGGVVMSFAQFTQSPSDPEPAGTRNELDGWIDAAIKADDRGDSREQVDDPDFAEGECGPPPTDVEFEAAREALSRWLTPSEFARATTDLCGRCRSSAWFNNSRMKFLHDAYVLARFAKAHAAERVRLSTRSEQWPDGLVMIAGRLHNIEITSTHGGRKLGDEYKNVTAEPEHDPVEDWVARAESIPEHLNRSIGKKVAKQYGSPCWLVVYLNISEWGIRHAETLRVIGDAKARYADRFGAIIVLWKGKFY